MRAAVKRDLNKKKGNADGEGRVRHIEGGPVQLSGVYVEEIYDMPVQEPVEQISGSAAEQQSIGESVGKVLDYQDRKGYARSHGDKNKEVAAEGLEHAEGRTRVFGVDYIEKRQDMYDIKRAEMCPYEIFCQLVQGQNSQRNSEKKERRFFNLRTRWHLSQTPG